MTGLETLPQIAALGLFIWVVRYQLPKASREQDALAVTCSMITAALALAIWLFVGIGAHSH